MGRIYVCLSVFAMVGPDVEPFGEFVRLMQETR
jgi:hypothetical protein